MSIIPKTVKTEPVTTLLGNFKIDSLYISQAILAMTYNNQNIISN
jgi:hypothetical protein